MFVNRPIENAANHAVQRVRDRAARRHRSLQGELPKVIEAAFDEERLASPVDILAETRRLGLQPPSEAAALIRADRNGR